MLVKNMYNECNKRDTFLLATLLATNKYVGGQMLKICLFGGGFF